MIAKTFKGGRTSRGARATLLYLLNQRVAEGTAKLLRGDQEITQSLINLAEKKQKWSWSSGVLSFEEHIEDRQTIEVIMDDFERTFFAGLEKDQYDILWVMHTDKGRTELHYVAPRMELRTGLSYNPYFVKRDFAKKDLFQEYINLKYVLSSYKDSREVAPRPPRWRETAQKKDIRKAFDEALLPLVEEGIITSREEMIYQLEEWGFALSRTGKEYITVLDENGNKHRLKGAIYGEDFTDWEAAERKAEADRRTVANGVQRELGAIRAELDGIIRNQSYANRERYNGVRTKEDTEVGECKLQVLQGDDRGREAGVDERVEKVAKIAPISSPQRTYLWLTGRDIYHPVPLTTKGVENQRERNSREQRWDEVSADKQDTKSNNCKGEVNDSARAEIIGRVRAFRARSRIRAEKIARIDMEIHEKYRERINQFERGISIQIDRAYEWKEYADRELVRVFDSSQRAKRPNYQLIEEATGAAANERATRQDFDAIFQRIRNGIGKLIGRIKQSIDQRTENLIVGVSHVVEKKKLFKAGKKQVLSKIRQKRILKKPRR